MYKLLGKDGRARTGKLRTRHGIVDTPMFMPVATKGAIKHLTTRHLEETGTQAIIANSWLLSLRPGIDIIADHGGLHEFMHWKGTIFTDSGRYLFFLDDNRILKKIILTHYKFYQVYFFGEQPLR